MIEQSYEAGIIVRLMTESSAIQECDLEPHEFSNEQLRTVYDAILTLRNRGDVIDWMTVSDYLFTMTNQNWGLFLAELIKDTPATRNMALYCACVRKANETRKAVEVAQILLERANAEGAIDNAIRDLMAISLPNKRHQYNMSTALKMALDDLEARSEGTKRGLPTGLIDLDEKLGGLHGGDLIVIGARPAMGKTALALNMALAVLDQGTPVGLFSGEQDVVQMTERMIAITGRIPIMRMRNGKMLDEDWMRLNIAGTRLKDLPLWVDDLESPSLNYIIRHSRAWRHQHGIGAIFLDYLQRMDWDRRLKRHEAVGENVRGLKNLARELDIPVVVLAQVNRDVERRTDKRPSMGDLADSSEIEKEADQVFLLYRDEVYNDDTSEPGICEILIDKNRHGPTGFVKTVWRGEYLRFENLARAA